jgi:hypothetical protein
VQWLIVHSSGTPIFLLSDSQAGALSHFHEGIDSRSPFFVHGFEPYCVPVNQHGAIKEENALSDTRRSLRGNRTVTLLPDTRSGGCLVTVQ